MSEIVRGRGRTRNNALGDPPVTILNVDDDDAARFAVSALLRDAGFQTAEARTGSEALRRAAEQPDLIILDVNLPDLNGFEICRRLKSDPALAAIPVLYLSGHFVRSQDRVHGLDLGADGYLIKPVAPEELLAHVRALLRVRRAERSLREEAALRAGSESRLRMILEQLPACLWTTDTELRITSSVGAGLAGLGLKPHQLVGTSLYQYLRTDDPNDAVILPHRRAVAGESIFYESEWQGRFFQTHLEPLRDEQGVITGSIGLAFDITERARAELAVRDSQRLLQAVTDGTPAGIYLKDREGRYIWINAVAASMVGRSVEEVIGKDAASFYDPETVRRILGDDRRIMASGQAETFEQVVSRAGSTSTYLTTKVPHRDDAGNVIGLLGISRDISERKRLEEQLRQAQKMEAIGRLAGGVAHDFNNLLTAIVGYSDLILMDCPDPAVPAHGHAAEIKRAAERAASLTRQLLAYGRQQVLSVRVLDLNSVVAEMERMLQRLIGKNIDMVTRLDPALRPVTADPGQLEQVLLNLVLNARDAMLDGGQLTIETANVELDAAFAQTHVDVRPGAYVCLSVEDTGCGMTDEVRAHVFEPFFTTKEVGKGTGLGLATVYGIVKQSGGHIELVSAPGHGSLFQVFLPQAREHARPERSSASASVEWLEPHPAHDMRALGEGLDR